MEPTSDQRVSILYTKHKGKTRRRIIKPGSIWWGSTVYHPEWQWILDAFDYEKQDFRQFAMKDIKEWSADITQYRQLLL